MNTILKTQNSRFDELLPKVLSDVVNLPSGGKFYSSGIDSVMVELMVAADEQYLLSENYIKNGSSFELLLKNKIKDENFKQNMTIDDLLVGDFDAILIFLGIGCYGADHEVMVTDTNGEKFSAFVDLTTLKPKKIVEPNSDLMFDFIFPKTGREVVFKLLTYGQRKELNKRIEKLNSFKKDGGSIFELQERVISQIHSIAGETDRSFIEKFVKMMPPTDSAALRKYMLEVEPSLDYNYEFEGKFTGDFFRQNVTIGPELFYPTR